MKMTKQELVTEIGGHFLKERSKTAREAAAAAALDKIDIKAPFVYAVHGLAVKCLQPIGGKSVKELEEMLETATRMGEAMWWYYHPSHGVIVVSHMVVVTSIEEYIRKRKEMAK